ncbi:hypothetical protein ACFVSW_26225 [Neobacillus sp. NPDC058068]|uniref:hypothetical protein n=1 Tax=Neobacillus sp. NPDC058068 TaxID=3346325 RepID=UPI0036DF2C60
MKIGEKKNFFYIPKLGFIEVVFWSEKETENRLFQVELNLTPKKQEILKILQASFPGNIIIHIENRWEIIPAK